MMTATAMPIPDGWTAESWAERLENLAAACSIPARAAELRVEADAIRHAHGLEPTRPTPARVQPPPHTPPLGTTPAPGRPSRHPASVCPPPRQLFSDTSIAGARHIAPHAHTLRAMILDALDRAGSRGHTREELCQIVSRFRGRALKEGSICGRIHELRAAGLVVDSGRTRRGNAGVACVVLVHHRYAPARREEL